MRKGFFVAAIVSIVVSLDYKTKQLIEAHIQLPGDEIVLPFFRIVNVKNTGAAFGIFSSLSNNFFIFISLVAIALIIIYMIKLPKGLELFSLSLILSGAAGNLIDRLTIGKVIDFIDFFGYWPAFNVADSAISIGVFLFLWSTIRDFRRHRKSIST